MLLLAEAFTINNQMDEALLQYSNIVEARSQPGAVVIGEPTKDIYRKMAPLYTNMKKFDKANEALQNVIDLETQEVLKVGLWTKIAGNWKRADNEEQCIKASKAAHEIMKKLEGANDSTTIKCRFNIA